MDLNGKITILINQDKTTIEIKDELSKITFARVTLTPEQLSQALSRLSNVECEIKVDNLQNVGKRLEVSFFEFKISNKRLSDNELKELAQSMLKDGWIADGYFGSKDSFFTDNNGVKYARCTIKRWV